MARFHVLDERGTPAAKTRRAIGRRQKDGPVILVPLDGSSLAELALVQAASLAKRLRSRLVLLTVYPDGGPGFDEDTAYQIVQEYDSAARGYVAGPLSRLASTGIAAGGIARSGDAATVICDVAREQNAGLIVMTTHGRSGVRRALLGSVSDAVLRRSPVPVLIVRSGQTLPAEFAFLATVQTHTSIKSPPE